MTRHKMIDSHASGERISAIGDQLARAGSAACTVRMELNLGIHPCQNS